MSEGITPEITDAVQAQINKACTHLEAAFMLLHPDTMPACRIGLAVGMLSQAKDALQSQLKPR